jgi:hypothetical protein
VYNRADKTERFPLYLAGNPQTTKAQKAIGVRVNQYGLPVIIPPSIRKNFRSILLKVELLLDVS